MAEEKDTNKLEPIPSERLGQDPVGSAAQAALASFGAGSILREIEKEVEEELVKFWNITCLMKYTGFKDYEAYKGDKYSAVRFEHTRVIVALKEIYQFMHSPDAIINFLDEITTKDEKKDERRMALNTLVENEIIAAPKPAYEKKQFGNPDSASSKAKYLSGLEAACHKLSDVISGYNSFSSDVYEGYSNLNEFCAKKNKEFLTNRSAIAQFSQGENDIHLSYEETAEKDKRNASPFILGAFPPELLPIKVDFQLSKFKDPAFRNYALGLYAALK
jgi:hypothetical protein